MAEEKRNLCAQIPISLHSRVRQEQEASGQTLSEYMTQLITDFFQMKEGNQNMNHDMKTIAFQVPVELFEEFKAYRKQLPSRCRWSCLRSSKPISSGTTSNKRNSSWAASRVPWRRSETQMEASGSEPEPQETDQTE